MWVICIPICVIFALKNVSIMRKYNLSLGILFCCITYSYAQHWDSLAGGLGGIPPLDGVNALSIYNGDLYAGGSLLYVDSGLCIGRWNNHSWERVGNGLGYYYPPCGACTYDAPAVYCLTEYKGNLFAGGFYDDTISGGAYSIAQWNEVSWDSVSSGLPGSSLLSNQWTDVAYCLAVYQNELYMGGSFQYTNAGTQVNYITRWSGGQWGDVGSGMNGYVFALAVYNGKLYAGGEFTIAGASPVKNIAMWDGTHWSDVSKGINGMVATLYVFNGKLYAGGMFDSAGTHRANNITCWNDTIWSPVGTGIAYENTNQYIFSSGVYALTNYGPDLCAGGVFDTAGNTSANNIALWDGLTWSNLGTGINGAVTALIEYNGGLIAGGYFDTAGGLPANNIAEWISPLGVNNFSGVPGLVKVYPNPSNGQFTIALSHSELVSESQTIEVYNVLGAKVYSAMLNQVQHNYKMNLSNQPNGVYVYRVIDDSGNLVGQGKLVVQK